MEGRVVECRPVIHLDTNIVIWLHRNQLRRLSRDALRALENERPTVSGAVLVELAILYEGGGRRNELPHELIEALGERYGLVLSPSPFNRVAAEAGSLGWTRDPFDRLIVADAIASGAKLVTADSVILDHFADAVW